MTTLQKKTAAKNIGAILLFIGSLICYREAMEILLNNILSDVPYIIFYAIMGSILTILSVNLKYTIRIRS